MTPEEYGKAYEKYFRTTVRTVVRKGIHDVGMAEDLAQQAWLQGWRKLDQLENSAQLLSWMTTIVCRARASYYRRLKEFEGLPEKPVTSRVTLEMLDIRRVFKFCELDDQRTMALHYTHGYSMPELEVKLGKRVNTLKVQTLRARQVMKKRLAPS
jgi:DNA-directed RNA polymerase specialized sigma24 family protein